ncbi:ATP-binding cassette domain-containing protein [Celerinatantimonas sp. MCCC 1A17872]|uniref:ATP-binding cassette domain-containing protein n=1 Tax=Celerinatantimonas sp. MCCC 1A17872 TaxID=3177514 RepID=UPI0038C85E3F
MEIYNISKDLLHKALYQKGIRIPKQLFDEEYDKLQEENLPPLKSLGLLCNNLNLRGTRLSMIRWDRLDRRVLPAPIFFNNQWWMADNSDEEEKIKIINEDEEEQEVTSEQLFGNCYVLWIKHPKISMYKNNIGNKKISKIILKEIFKSKSWLTNCIIASVIINTLVIFTSLFSMQVYDRVVPTLAFSTLTTLSFGMLIAIAISFVLKVLRSRIIESLAAEVDDTVSLKIFDHLLKLKMGVDNFSLGLLHAQVSSYENIRRFFSGNVIFSIVDLPFAFLFIAFIYLVGHDMGIVYTIFFGISLIVGLFSYFLSKDVVRKQITQSNEREGLLVDSIRGLETIRTNNANWRFLFKWKGINSSVSKYSYKQRDVGQLCSSIISGLGTMAYVSAIIVGVIQIANGDLTTGGIVASTIVGSRIINPVAQLANTLVRWQGVSQSIALVDGLLNKETERKYEQDLLLLEKSVTKIALANAKFFYPESPTYSFYTPELEFNSGDRVLILGSIGGGKSTLLKMLAGIYRPNEGMVKINDIDLWEVDPIQLSTEICYLSQDSQLFKGTLRDNLSLSGMVAPDYVSKIANELGINQFAYKSPYGFDMPVQEGGQGLSGGQKQLVALNRVISSNPSVWLLDEPTTSMDKLTQERVLATLKSYVKPSDILIVSSHNDTLLDGYINRVINIGDGNIISDSSLRKPVTRINKNIKLKLA